MKHIFFYTLLVMMFFSCNKKTNNNNALCDETADSATIVQTPMKYGVDITNMDNSIGIVKQNQLLGNIFSDLGVPDSIIVQLSYLNPEDFDVRRVRAGNKYTVYFKIDSVNQPVPHYFVYHHSLIEASVFHLTDSLAVTHYFAPTQLKTEVAEFEITSSLWNAVNNSNLDMAFVNDLSDIFAWTVDFFGLQKGDRFCVYYDRVFVDSISIGIGKIHGAYYANGAKRTYAIHFANDSVDGYWDLEGNSVKKAFLKAPLHFSRISSGFSYARKHPVHKTVRPHTGVDYAAPAGTPVVSIGDGVVVAKGYKGGGGNTVRIRHNSSYESAYLHLRGFGEGVQVGAHVSQGQVIGYVGSTGTSTGAHLDFRIWRNGTPINPLTLDSPPTEPIPDMYRPQFESVKSQILKHLE